jgi:hypothetical protein
MKKPKTASTRPIRNDLYTQEACFQRRIRIRLALAAYAYEFESDSIMTDADFDNMSMMVDTSIDTGAPDLDFFFSEEFDPSTGNWVHKHPELEKVRHLYWRLKDMGVNNLSMLYDI